MVDGSLHNSQTLSEVNLTELYEHLEEAVRRHHCRLSPSGCKDVCVNLIRLNISYQKPTSVYPQASLWGLLPNSN